MKTLHPAASPQQPAGMSLVELLVVIAIIGILAALTLPAISKVADSATATATSANLITFTKAFRAYEKLEKQWPPDALLGNLPAGIGMEDYISETAFESETSIGGFFNWEGPEAHEYAGVSIEGSSAPVELVTRIDEIVDDGNLSTGQFRQTPNGRYTYIIEWNDY
ncbi:MAG: type II secretion system protein [Verrucomicrobiota bacterium]